VATQTNGPRRVATLRRPITTVLNGRRNYNPAVNPVNKSCGHIRAVVRSVTTPGGDAGYLCFNCYAHLRAIEYRVIVRREFAKLFRQHCPRIFWSGGVVAPIGGEVAR
jgi:hypothetical protein